MAEWKMPYGSGHEGLEVEAFLKVIFLDMSKVKAEEHKPFLAFWQLP